MIHEFLFYVQDKVVRSLINNQKTIPGNYYLLDIAYLLLNCYNSTFFVTEIETTWEIPHSTMALITFWKVLC